PKAADNMKDERRNGVNKLCKSLPDRGTSKGWKGAGSYGIRFLCCFFAARSQRPGRSNPHLSAYLFRSHSAGRPSRGGNVMEGDGPILRNGIRCSEGVKSNLCP